MIVHYITRESNDAGDRPFAQELKRLNPNVKFFARYVDVTYKRKINLLLNVYPRWFLFALWAAFKSLMDKRKPEAVVVESDIEILGYKLALISLFRKPPVMVFSGFIYTGSESLWLSLIKKYYYMLVLSCVNYVIVHSRKEVKDCSETFGYVNKFIYIPYGIGAPLEKVDYDNQVVDDYVFSAGRSCRDYETLHLAAKKTCYQYKVVCDSFDALPDYYRDHNFEPFRKCYEYEYIKMLLKSRLVVIPLSDTNVSAGQMVLLHAMAYRKPIIITDTETVRDYTHDIDCVKFVGYGDVDGMVKAIEELMSSYTLRSDYARKAGFVYDKYHTIEAKANNYHLLIKNILCGQLKL